MKKYGFTLAEVLITLGIIGVVAAMTIPMLRQAYYEHQTVAQLKETYSILSQAIRLAEEEYGEIEGWGITGHNTESAELIASKLKPYLKVVLDCGTDNSDNKCTPNSIYKLLYGVENSQDIRDNTVYKLVLINGSTIYMRGNPSDTAMVVYVDTNGKTPPNTYGKDLFEFTYSSKLGFIPSGHPDNAGNTYVRYCSNLSQRGYGCAYYVLHFGNMNYLHKKN